MKIPFRFSNSDPNVVVGNFPWYEMVWRSLRGDFRPLAPPQGGYAEFARKWTVPVDLEKLSIRQRDPVITWLGHVTLLLQLGGLNLLIDPTLADFAGPFGRFGAARRTPPPIAPEQLPALDAILITHNHYDHLCDDTIGRLWAAGQRPAFFVPRGLKSWFDSRNISRVSELDWWDTVQLAAAPGTLNLSFTPSQHWSRRTPFDTNQSLWGGYALEWRREDKSTWRFLFPGDTGYSSDFKEIRKRLGKIDFLALPIGAYLPRDFMKPMHVNPDDAVRLMLDLEASQAVGVHWGTFMLTQEAFDAPPRELADAMEKYGMAPERIWLMKHGETRPIPMTGTF